MRRIAIARLAQMVPTVSVAGVARPARAGGYPYILGDLGTLGGSFSNGQGVNDFGQVAGDSTTAAARTTCSSTAAVRCSISTT